MIGDVIHIGEYHVKIKKLIDEGACGYCYLVQVIKG